MAREAFNPDKFAAELSEKLLEASRAPNIKRYKPHEKQYLFHSSTRNAKLYIGGNRSGKTTGGVCEAIWRATCTHPYRPELNAIGPNRGRVVGVDFQNGVEKIIYPQYKQWLYPSALRGGSWQSAYDKFTRTLNFANGSTIEFMSYDQDLDKFAGTSRHWIHFDEEPPRSIWVECMARLIDTEGEYWVTMTPVEGMTWVYEDLYEPNINNADGNVEIIEINTLENPYLSAKAIQNFANTIDDEDVATRIGGGFVQKGGRIYKDFDPTKGARQVLPDSMTIDEPDVVFDRKQWLWIMCLDHGLKNPTAVLWLAIDPQGFIVCFDEYYKTERTIEENAKAIKEKIRYHGRFPDLLVADPSIANRNPVTGTSIQQEYQSYGLSFTLGNNDVKAGIVRTKKYFKSAPYIVQENRTPKFWKENFFDRRDVGEDLALRGNRDLYRMYFDPRCVNVISELKKYRWKTYADKKKQFENNPYDEPHKKDDHACDALRYGIMTRPDLVSSDNNLTPESVDDIMRQLGERVGVYDPRDVADPNGVYEGAVSTFQEGGFDPLRSPLPSGDGWDYDEHLGGLM